MPFRNAVARATTSSAPWSRRALHLTPSTLGAPSSSWIRPPARRQQQEPLNGAKRAQRRHPSEGVERLGAVERGRGLGGLSPVPPSGHPKGARPSTTRVARRAPAPRRGGCPTPASRASTTPRFSARSRPSGASPGPRQRSTAGAAAAYHEGQSGAVWDAERARVRCRESRRR